MLVNAIKKRYIYEHEYRSRKRPHRFRIEVPGTFRRTVRSHRRGETAQGRPEDQALYEYGRDVGGLGQIMYEIIWNSLAQSKAIKKLYIPKYCTA